MAFSYRAMDMPPVTGWHIDSFIPEDDPEEPRFGELLAYPFVVIQERGEVISIDPRESAGSISMTKEEAVVLAQDILTNYADEVGPITRET